MYPTRCAFRGSAACLEAGRFQRPVSQNRLFALKWTAMTGFSFPLRRPFPSRSMFLFALILAPLAALFLPACASAATPAFPLHTSGQYIVDSNGVRVHLNAFNWYGSESSDFARRRPCGAAPEQHRGHHQGARLQRSAIALVKSDGREQPSGWELCGYREHEPRTANTLSPFSTPWSTPSPAPASWSFLTIT